MNRGDDSEAYLAKGYNVIALEANPVWTKKNAEALQDYIDDGRLTILNKMVDKTTDTSMSFFVPKLKPETVKVLNWLEGAQLLKTDSDFISHSKVQSKINNTGGNSRLFHLDEVASGSRDEACNKPGLACSDEHPICSCEEMTIKSTTCTDLIRQYGVPHYMKVDIEGFDGHCMKGLAELPCNMMPAYISFEEQGIHLKNAGTTLEMIDVLSKRGYQWKVSRQSVKDHAELGSGPFGEDVSDFVRGNSWSSGPDVSDHANLECWGFGDTAIPSYDCDVHGKFVASEC